MDGASSSSTSAPSDYRKHVPDAGSTTAPDCEEGFYGVRLYYDRTGTWQVGVCIQRMDLCLPLEEFLTSPVSAEIIGLRNAEYTRLRARPVG
ncbi:hypothetical protein [Nocardia salmonicida]|uniref:hypothetical protein n=1 Tax=Nocardia salmonicida TaxID=53431 RepID=UPI00363B621F